MDRSIEAWTADEQLGTAPHQALLAIAFVLKALQYANRVIIWRMVSKWCQQTKHEQA